MSDTPTSDQRQQVQRIKYVVDQLLRDLSLLNYERDFPDLRHASSKLQSADRGLDDFLARRG